MNCLQNAVEILRNCDILFLNGTFYLFPFSFVTLRLSFFRYFDIRFLCQLCFAIVTILPTGYIRGRSLAALILWATSGFRLVSIIILLFAVFGRSFMQEWIVRFTVSYRLLLLHFYTYSLLFLFFAHLISLDYIWINMRRKDLYKYIYINLLCLNVDVWIKPDLTGSPYRNSVPSYFFSVGASYSNYYASFGTISTQHLHLHLHLHLHRLSCRLQHSIEEYSLLSHSSVLPVSNQTNLKVQNV